MPATSFYADAASNTKKSRQAMEEELIIDDGELSADEIQELEVAAVDPANFAGNTNRRSTDLVRLYLQEIGRVRLLGRDEEVSEAQKVQRYLRMRTVLADAAKEGDEIVAPFLNLVQVQERLTSELGHRPSLERWANTAGIELVDLKPTLANGKRRWAEIAQLTVEELEQVQSQGLQAKEHMIKANLRLVVSVAKKYQNRGLELLDLVQEGTLGLERAVEKFDPTKGYRFSTYAYWWIRQGITRAIATSSRTIRLPVHITEKLNKIKKAQRKIAQEKGRTPTLEDLAIELEMTPTQVREVLLKVPRSVSLETKVGKDKDTELGELLETDCVTPEEMLMRESLQKDLHSLLADLTSRERDVILMRFGLSDGHPYSLAEIGRALDLSRERVRQIESKALQKLRQPKRRNLIRDYLESLS
ncbi:RNA polymerase sigma factor SigC [Nodularia spumigena CS-584]|jgi:RNA polymerase nonessential primary-like sigma factor|uniref:RNA polymerase sigma factor n=2 Tax=Nodularia spumigena TaxID=70799 RepID=A0A2S0QB44_NODSP|nr:RNA polymerase sigma factor SigC [Nodularia spumigena]AHJ28623.1 Group 2 RNA polymerase sigma factor Cyanobacteria-specific RpoD-like sigma factor, type-7 [Nodularia spumigena CCY9414]AVZ31578.1 RNA polymerase nonessential primary-like sigma factor [Nodularia spumigena UHCC 0039]MDB9383712.1 RNA polymerase sigma factor SigC [Nodularia spumigena CS-584]MEA5526367.1 RNA polymerase sigma factor SigC [Nodularia spumigena UHCC 0143]MEA5611073.1 RNA polymerase sigma factor SigC [Nodularia spumige